MSRSMPPPHVLAAVDTETLVDVAEFLLLRRDLTTQDQNRQEVAA